LTTERNPEGDHYLTTVPTDAWGRPYSYAVESIRLGTYDLRSYGPDSLPGTDDDIVADSKPVPVR
jgi:capsid protein